jgi:hypothetical protein
MLALCLALTANGLRSCFAVSSRLLPLLFRRDCLGVALFLCRRGKWLTLTLRRQLASFTLAALPSLLVCSLCASPSRPIARSSASPLERALLPSGGFAIVGLPLLFVLCRRIKWLALSLHRQVVFFTLTASPSLLGSCPVSLPPRQIARTCPLC